MRRLVWFTVGFAAACVLGAYWLRGVGLLLCAVAALVGMGGALLRREQAVLRRTAAVLLGFGLGCSVFFCWDYGYYTPARLADGSERTLEFTATSTSWAGSYGSTVDGLIVLDGMPYKVRLYLSEYREVTPGERLTASVRLRLTDEGGAGEPTFHRSNGILLLGYQKDTGSWTPGEPGWQSIPGIFRQRLLDILEEAVPADAAGFVKALLLGYQVDLAYEHCTDFNTTGISHIVAVSGLHVSILFALVYLVSGKNRYLTALLGIPAVVLFAALAGFTPSVTRAAVMQVMMMLAMLVNREYDPATALAAAVLGMLCCGPLVITSAGFQLSVLSVAGIFLFSHRIRDWLLLRLPKRSRRRVPGRAVKALVSGVSVTVSASVLSVPLVAYYYGTVSLISTLTNLLVVPVVTAVFYGAMAVCGLGLFHSGLAAAAGWLLAWPVRYVCGVADVLARFPLAAVYTASVYTVIWLVFCYGLIANLVFGKHPRPLVSIACAAVALSVALGLSWAEPMLDSYRVTVLDVGQGQCVVLQSGGATFVVDCGGDYPQDAADTAAQYLLSMGIRRIDGLILTHYDRDHAGGVEYLTSRIDIDRVYLPDTPDSDGLLSRVVQSTADSDQVWVDSDLVLTFETGEILLFAPESGQSGNESCVAVLFRREEYDTLITGDLSAFRERQLLRRYDLPDVEVLIAGHHGSNTSTCSELLAAITPEAVLISVGQDNPYGHPAEETLARLAEFGCRVWRTDQQGTLIYRR